MKRISLFVILSLVFTTCGILNAQPRQLGARRLVLDNGDNVTANNLFVIDVNGNLGIDNTGLTTVSFPSAATLLSLKLGAKTTGLNIAGGSTSLSADGTIQTTGDVKLGPGNTFFAASGEENLRIVRGNVNTNGSIANGTGFTITHTAGTGVYTINFNNAFSGNPSIVVTEFFGGGTAQGNVAGNGSAQITTNTAGPGTPADFGFSFIVIGPR